MEGQTTNQGKLKQLMIEVVPTIAVVSETHTTEYIREYHIKGYEGYKISQIVVIREELLYM